jgi:hypothetical protein
MKKIILCILSGFAHACLGNKFEPRIYKIKDTKSYEYLARVDLKDIMRDQAYLLKACAISGAIVSSICMLNDLKQAFYGIKALMSMPRL